MKVTVGVYAILWTQTLDALATMTILPTIPFYAMGLGADAFTISMLGSSYNMAQMVCSPGLGALSDRIGRKTVMLLGLTGQAMCNMFMGYTTSVSTLVFVRVLAGIALSTGPVETAYIMDAVTSEADLSHVFALQRFMTSAGALLGPMVACAIDEYPFDTLCKGLVCINIANIMVGFVLWEDAPRKDPLMRRIDSEQLGQGSSSNFDREDRPPSNLVASLRSLLANPTTCSLLLVSWVYTLSFGIGDGPEVMFFKDHFGFGKDQVCYFFIVTNLSSLVFSSFVPRIVESFGARMTCKVGCLGAASSVMGLTVLSGIGWVPYACGALEVGLFGSMIGLSYMHLVRKTCPEALMGTMLGLQSSMNGFAATVGLPTGGALYDWNNYLPFVLSAVLGSTAAGLYAALPTAERSELRPLMPSSRLPKKAVMRRVSTFGLPIYPDKSFTTQVHANLLRLETDPELWALYQTYREFVDKERGSLPGSLKAVATVPGDMVAAQAEALQQQNIFDLGRSDTIANMIGIG